MSNASMTLWLIYSYLGYLMLSMAAGVKTMDIIEIITTFDVLLFEEV